MMFGGGGIQFYSAEGRFDGYLFPREEIPGQAGDDGMPYQVGHDGRVVRDDAKVYQRS